jgi:hypothetical protein
MCIRIRFASISGTGPFTFSKKVKSLYPRANTERSTFKILWNVIHFFDLVRQFLYVVNVLFVELYCSLYRVPEYLSFRRNLVSPSPPLQLQGPLGSKGGGEQHLLGGETVGGTRFGRLERKPGTLYALVMYTRD